MLSAVGLHSRALTAILDEARGPGTFPGARVPCIAQDAPLSNWVRAHATGV